MKSKFCFIIFAISLFAIIFALATNPTFALTFNYGFETGDLTDWEAEGEAFEFQPTWGDNPTARNRGEVSNHEGNWWIGGFERYQGPEKGAALGQNPGDVQGDGPQGSITSIQFMIVGDKMNFLIGGGNHPWDSDPNPCCVNLVIDDEVVRTETGANSETMQRKEWDVTDLKGQIAQIVVLDRHGAGWGHLNFDDIHQADSGGNIPWAQATAVEARGKLAVSWAQMKKYYR